MILLFPALFISRIPEVSAGATWNFFRLSFRLHRLHELTFSTIKKGYVLTNKSSNIEKTTTTNQYRRVPDLWRPGSDEIKRYYTKNGGLISTAKLMHQSIPAVPIPPRPRATAGHLLTLSVPGVGYSQFYRSPGGWALAYPGATPEHLTRVFERYI